MGRRFLGAASTVFGAVVWARSRAYDAGLLSVRSVETPVVSIGNLLAGGTGKTPLAEAISRMLAQRGLRVVLLSRGYRGRVEKDRRPVRVDPSASAVEEVERCGDEPFMLAQRLRGEAEVVVCPDRVAGARWAERELRAEVIVLDDGFQHRSLARDLDLVIFPDGKANVRGDLDLMPLGLLREPVASAERADLVLVPDGAAPATGTNQVCFSLVPGALLDHAGQPIGSAADLRGRRVALLTAVARPETFERDIRSSGATVVERWFQPDHGDFPVAGLRRFLERARGAGAQDVIVTAKDAVKLDSAPLDPPLKVLDRDVRWDVGGDILAGALDALVGRRSETGEA